MPQTKMITTNMDA